METIMSEVAKTTAPAAELVKAERSVGDVLVNTFSGGTREDMVRAYNAIDNTKSLRKEKMVGKTFGLTNIIIREEQFTDPKTGDVQETKNVILEAGPGTAYYMSSETLARSCADLITAFKLDEPGAFDEPLNVQVVDGITANGFTFYKITPVI